MAARWVIGFVPDPVKFLNKLVFALRPGGIIALQDYVYEGLSLYPRGGAFEGMADAVRAYWRSGGGDPFMVADVRFGPLEGSVVRSSTAPAAAGGQMRAGVQRC